MAEVPIETVDGMDLMELTRVTEADGAVWSIFIKADDIAPILDDGIDPEAVSLLVARRRNGILAPALAADLERLAHQVDLALASLLHDAVR
jgi:hypothetical protein